MFTRAIKMCKKKKTFVSQHSTPHPPTFGAFPLKKFKLEKKKERKKHPEAQSDNVKDSTHNDFQPLFCVLVRVQ